MAVGRIRIPVAREGYPFIFATAVLTLLFFFTGPSALAILFFVGTAFTLFFFRDPERVTSAEDEAILSPADGRVLFAGRVFEGRYLKRDLIKVSIFMSLFDVHVNRAPVDGVLVRKSYIPGRFISANRDKASLENEQCFYLLDTGKEEVGMVQIAGLIARRIVSWKEEGERVRRGERIGLIRFGSRVDLFLPLHTELSVRQGERVYGGKTVVGFLRSK